jgi:hypothetical protein
MLWLVAPTFRPAGFRLEWGDLLATTGIGGIVLAVALWRIEPPRHARPLHGARQHG